jgi:ammonia channel protein AmtB
MVQGLGCAYLLQYFEPDVLGPMGCDWRHHESLELDIAQDDIAVHAYAGRCGGLTVGVTGTDQIVQTGLQGELEVGARFKLASDVL